MTTSKEFVIIGQFQKDWWVLERLEKGKYLMVYPPYLLHLLHFMPLSQAFSHCRLQAAGSIAQMDIDRPWPDEVWIDEHVKMERKEFLRSIRTDIKSISSFLAKIIKITG